METLQTLFDPDVIGTFVVLCAAYVLFVLVPFCALFYLIYFLHTLPLRRKERARIFLDLIEVGMQEGARPEQALATAFSRPLRPLGPRFTEVGKHLARGLSLSEALKLEPTLLPPAVMAMLRAGERLGDVRKVFPACRVHLAVAVSQVRAAINYLVLLLFVVTPAIILVSSLLSVKVLPKFRELVSDMADGQLPAFTQFVFGESRNFVLIQCLLFIAMLLALTIYVGGPRFTRYVNRLFPGLADRIAFQLPWKRKRLYRDFSTMLSVLLDNGVPESEAVDLAAESTANVAMIRRARFAQERLRVGSSLLEAVSMIDDSGEFRWRFRNAAHRRKGFFAALSGWHEALEAKAFQQEQNAAQLTTSVLVLINGLFVGSIVVGVFMVLIHIVGAVTLW